MLSNSSVRAAINIIYRNQKTGHVCVIIMLNDHIFAGQNHSWFVYLNISWSHSEMPSSHFGQILNRGTPYSISRNTHHNKTHSLSKWNKVNYSCCDLITLENKMVFPAVKPDILTNTYIQKITKQYLLIRVGKRDKMSWPYNLYT